MKRRYRYCLLSILLTVGILGGHAPAKAGPLTQADPVEQCAEGVRLFGEGQAEDALPWLEAGFAGRTAAAFSDPDDLGMCALALSKVRSNASDALEAGIVALDVFRTNANRLFEGTTLGFIGAVYASLGRYGEALEAYQQALAIEREVGNRAGEGTTLNNMGAVHDRQGRYTEALDALQQALAIEREVGDHAGEGATLHNIGEAYGGQGRYGEALDTLQQALAIEREVSDRAGEGATLAGIGAVYHNQGRYGEALETYQQALAIEREVGNRAGEGATLNGIGVVYISQGRYAEALEALQQALAIRRTRGNRADEGTTLNDIGGVYYSQGHHDEALDAYLQALAIEREVGDRAGEGGTLAGIGAVYHGVGRYGEALEALQQALVIMREVGDRAGEGTTLNNMGAVHDRQGRYGEALDAYQQALAIEREVGDHAGEGATLHNISTVYHSQGRDSEALETYEQVLTIARSVGDLAGEGMALNNISAVYLGQGRYAEALETYQQALAIQREVGDRAGEGMTLTGIGAAYHNQGRYGEALDTLQQALTIEHEIGDRQGEGATLINIGHTYRQQGEPEQALVYYDQAMGVIESVRTIAGSEGGRAGFIAQYVDLYNNAVTLYHQLRQDAAAFQTSERGRGRSFLDSLATGFVELSDDEAADLYTREQEAYASRQAAQDALAPARAAQPADPALVADLEAQFAAAENDHAVALAAIQARGDQLASLVPGRSGVFSLPEVQALLDQDTTLVAYHVLGDAGSLAFVITANDMQVVELPEATPQNLRTAVDDLSAWRSRENPYPRSLQDLYRWLVAPLADLLKTPCIALVPHNLLHYVPFAALTDGVHYLGEQYELVILPSASSLRFIQQNAAVPDRNVEALVFGNPISDVPDLKPLVHAEQEAMDTAGLLGVPVYLTQNATEARLRSSSAGAKVVHLSAHGGYNVANPLYSTIYLAPGDGQDGRLETHEVYSLDLKGNELVVLSACQTNVGELSGGDEVVGLTRAFFFAGAPTVISSLWSVDDAATGVLMTAFYRHWLQDGMSKAQALQAAQADVRSDPRWVSPFFWAGFVLNGDPGVRKQHQLPNQDKHDAAQQSPALYGALTLVVLLVGSGIIVIVFRRRRYARA